MLTTCLPRGVYCRLCTGHVLQTLYWTCKKHPEAYHLALQTWAITILTLVAGMPLSSTSYLEALRQDGDFNDANASRSDLKNLEELRLQH